MNMNAVARLPQRRLSSTLYTQANTVAKWFSEIFFIVYDI